eukprot:3851871-Amphidinium_carterae.3
MYIHSLKGGISPWLWLKVSAFAECAVSPGKAFSSVAKSGKLAKNEVIWDLPLTLCIQVKLEVNTSCAGIDSGDVCKCKSTST